MSICIWRMTLHGWRLWWKRGRMGHKAPDDGRIRGSKWISIEDQNSFGFVMWQKKPISGKTAAIAQWGNEKTESQGRETEERKSDGESESRRETASFPFLSNQFVSLVQRSAEEDKLYSLAAGASSKAWNPFDRENIMIPPEDTGPST